MPNLIERRRMKRRQKAIAQSPVYNIFYTESVPVQKIPMFTQNHAQSFPQLNQLIYSNLGPQKSSFPAQNIIKENNNKSYDVPIYSEEDQTRCSSMQHQNQALRTYAPDFVDHQQNLPQNLCGYGADYQSNNPGLSSAYQSYDRVNVSNQHITLPAQPVGSTEGYSMKIEVLATPLKADDHSRKNTLAEKQAFEDNSHFLRIDDSIRSQKNQTVIQPAKQILFQSGDGKKRWSLLSKIRRKINKKRSHSIVDDDNDYNYRANSAQEILSPRQLLESTTNVCSSVQSSEIPRLSNNEATDCSNVAATTFQEALKNLEDSLKITEDVETPSVTKISDSDHETSATSFVCSSCKLKSNSDVVHHSEIARDQESRGHMSSRSRACRQNSCKYWQSSYPRKSSQGSLHDLHHNARRHRFHFKDHSPPERDQPTQLRECTDYLEGNERHDPPIGSCPPACCGLVMYGQKHAISQYAHYYH